MGAQAGPGPGPAGMLPPGAEPRLPCPWARALATMAPAPPWASTSRHAGPSCSRAGRPAWLLESYARPQGPRQAALGVGHSQAPRTPAGNPGASSRKDGAVASGGGRRADESRTERPRSGPWSFQGSERLPGQAAGKTCPGLGRREAHTAGRWSCGCSHFVTDCFPVFH